MTPIFVHRFEQHTPNRQQDIQKWLMQEPAQFVREHIETQIRKIGNEAMQQALDSDVQPNRALMSNDLLKEAQRYRDLLKFWDTITQPNYQFEFTLK